MSKAEVQLSIPFDEDISHANVDELLRSITDAIQDQLNQEDKAQEIATQFTVQEVTMEEVISTVKESPVQDELTIPSVVVPENLFVSESALQLINKSKEDAEEATKSIVVDIPESSGKSVEDMSVAEVAVFVDVATQTDSVIDEVSISQGKALTVVQDFQPSKLAIPSDLMLDNILKNLSEISSVLHQVK